MKKFYAFALAAVVALSASAADFQTKQAIAKKNLSEVAEMSMKKVDKVAAKQMKATPKATSLNGLNGTYDWTFKSLLNGSSPNPELVITVDNEATGAATISGFPQNYKVAATIDLAANTVTIANKQNLGPDSYGDVNYFYLKPVNGSNIGDGASTAAATVGTISGNTISFPTLDVWAIGDPEQEDLGYWMMTYSNVFTMQKEKVLYGTGTVSGDMYFGAFGATPRDYSVDVYALEDDGTQLYVKNPLKGLYEFMGWSSESPEMYIDATISDNLLIPPFSLGINGGEEDGMYYGMSISYNQQNINDTPTANRITINKESGKAIINIPVQGMYIWPSNTTTLYRTITSPVTITISLNESGVDEVAAEEEFNAPVEYFNLQGVRVENPAAGTLVIRRQGAKAEKFIVR